MKIEARIGYLYKLVRMEKVKKANISRGSEDVEQLIRALLYCWSNANL